MSATATTPKFSIKLSDGSTHEVEGDSLKAATTKLLKRKAIKDAGLTVVVDTPTGDTPPDELTPEEIIANLPDTPDVIETPDVAETPDVLATLPQIIADYFAAEASQDPTAPMHGSPFKQGDPPRLYLQLEGRGGAGKGQDDYTPTGLRPYMLKTLGDATPSKGAIKSAINALGFERRPFSYNHPERGSSSASYYSAPASNLSTVAPVEARHAAPRSSKKAAGAINAPVQDVVIPQNPEGNDEDVARLNALRQAYINAQDELKTLTAGFGRKPIKSDASQVTKDAMKAEREGLKAAAIEKMNEAHEELLAQRKVMHSKNEAAAKHANGETSDDDAPRSGRRATDS